MEKANNHEMGNSLFNILYKTTTLSNICGTFIRFFYSFKYTESLISSYSPSSLSTVEIRICFIA